MSANICSQKSITTKKLIPKKEMAKPACPVDKVKVETLKSTKDIKRPRKFLQHHILPLWPVQVEGPSITHCRGIVTGSKSQQIKFQFPHGENTGIKMSTQKRILSRDIRWT